MGEDHSLKSVDRHPGITVPHQPFRAELTDRRRTTLLLYYLATLLSVVAVSLAGRILPVRAPLLVLAVAGAAATILFLLRFLRSNDEHEQQINYRALTFALTGTLIFSPLSASFRASVFIPCPG